MQVEAKLLANVMTDPCINNELNHCDKTEISWAFLYVMQWLRNTWKKKLNIILLEYC